MLPSETMIWQPEFTDKTLSRKPGAVHSSSVRFVICLPAKLFPGTRPGSGNNYGFTLRICLTSISTEFQSLSTSP
ncbi:hypothetical protein C0R78_03285 [Escherichia coli]|nr:hypothetical protein C0R78_03285 [Escherichia coli]